MKMINFLMAKKNSGTRNEEPYINRCSSVEALVKLNALNVGYVAWTSSSMTPKSIVYILNEIIINKRCRIMELGMGISTIFILRLMQEMKDIQLLSLDHDQEWIDICKLQFQAKCLSTDKHTIVYAPLTKQDKAGFGSFNYYDPKGLSIGQTFNPDLVIIDGPPAWHEDIWAARIPAYEALSTMVSSDTTIFIDDYQRKGEAKLLDVFLANHSWKLLLKDPIANVAILRNKRANYNVF